ncbi:HET-domain-containing protein [Mytilinidion resinicola]|uniref:HET-domain-containing protein n=1 Tax=Mytilinidion resinicola TaxID=574789 RepID=A0A6A6Z5X7_9PEZI|nr:HET-domain-containing protein [Mytilinidion resinicola]KAF2815615.1 HET-domain-containing protein [Mytilinidion resinicola]
MSALCLHTSANFHDMPNSRHLAFLRKMRLLRTSDFKVISFFDQDLPPCAILSHTWGKEEVTLQDLQQERITAYLISLKIQIANGDTLQNIEPIKQGLVKILGAASQAEKDGFEYIWCDTCCIDKTNSTELSEAINSMYQWYKGRHCYAYLADVLEFPSIDYAERDSAFARSRWFKRGWTLQELIAPSSVAFFNEAWQFIGTRSELGAFISETTGIDRAVLDGEDPGLSSIAKRMSWAAGRKTTRVEDIAYCLMGLFGVNMPLLYGEREKAFLRLQEEIMKRSEDHSLFAWKRPLSTSDNEHSGLLATSPADFSESRHIIQFLRDQDSGQETHFPYSMTNIGINISLPMLQIETFIVANTKYVKTFLAILDCQDTTDTRGPLGIYLICNERGYYRRCHLNKLIPAGTNTSKITGGVRTKNLYVEQHEVAPRIESTALYQFYIPGLPERMLQYGAVLEVFPNKRIASWNSETGILRCSRGLGGAVFIGRADGFGRILLVGVDSQLHPQCAFDKATDPNFKSFISDAGFKTHREIVPALVHYRSYVTQGSEKPERFFIERNSQWLALKEVDVNKVHGWDEWISEREDNTTDIDLGAWETSTRQDSWFFQSKLDKIWNKFDMWISADIKEDVIKGQKMFSVRLSNDEFQRILPR